MQRKRFQRLTVLAAAFLVALAAGSPADAAPPRSVLTTAQFITDLRFDDSRLAWVQTGWVPVCGGFERVTVYRYSFATRTTTRLTNPWCNVTATGYLGRLVLQGSGCTGRSRAR